MITEYTMRIQCRTNDGKVGDFIAERTTNKLVSPLFDSLVDLYPWMTANGWKLDEYTPKGFVPLRVVQIKGTV